MRVAPTAGEDGLQTLKTRTRKYGTKLGALDIPRAGGAKSYTYIDVTAHSCFFASRLISARHTLAPASLAQPLPPLAFARLQFTGRLRGVRLCVKLEDFERLEVKWRCRLGQAPLV